MSRGHFGHLTKYVFCLCTFVFCLQNIAVRGQSTHNGVTIHEAVMNSTWRAINTLNNQYVGLGEGRFSSELRALDGKTVTLSGYMIPIRSASRHERFMLSVLPLLQCMFCGQGEIPPLIEVVMKSGAVPFSDFPVEIRGTLLLDIRPDGGAEVKILESELM